MNPPDQMQLGLLPARKTDWRSVAGGYGLVALCLFIVVFIGLLFPDRLAIRSNYTVTELIARPDLQPKPLELKPERRPVIAKLAPVPQLQAPKLIVPRELRVQKPKVEEAPKVAVDTFKPVLVETAVARPAKLLYTGSFGSAATATIKAQPEKVQTGGFGDPNGTVGEGKSNARMTVASVGSFDAPQGPGTGNGTGGTHGIKGTIASAGFGNGVAAEPGSATRHAVQTGGFGAQTIAQSSVPQKQAAAVSSAPVEILYKPNPVYTEEARQLHLEGEVLLEVAFNANGQLHVNRVVRGLGHGLDQAAVNAANQIRFKPAMRGGVPYDSTAVVHVRFELAF